MDKKLPKPDLWSLINLTLCILIFLTLTIVALFQRKFIIWIITLCLSIFLIVLSPIIGVLSIFVSSAFVGRLISTDGVEALMMLGGISTVGLGISLVIVGCTKNIIQKITK